MTRSRTQRAIDLLLVLDAAKVVGDQKQTPGAVAFHKILFHAKLDASTRGLRAPHHQYIRWKHGPFSRDATDDEQLLTTLGLMRGHAATARAAQLVIHYRPLVAGTIGDILECVERSARKRAKWSGKKAKADCYGIRAERLGVDPSIGRTLRDLPQGTPLHLDPVGGADLRVDEDLVDDFLLDLRITDADIRASREIEFSGSVTEVEHELERRSVRKLDHFDRLRRGDRL